MTHLTTTLLLASAALVLAAAVPVAHAKPGGEWDDAYEARTFKDESAGLTLPYRLHNPAAKAGAAEAGGGKAKYPLVLLLHGAGERGADNFSQLKWGGHLLGREAQAKFPCFVVAPQCPGGKQWVNTPWGNGSYSTEKVPASDELKAAVAAVKSVMKEFGPSVDPARVYVVGLSMGGYGAWDAAARWPELFAAAVPICGAGDPSKAADLEKHKVAAWAFHGAKDSVVPPSGSREMADAMKKAGTPDERRKYTEYPDVDHGSWLPAFGEPELMPWLFAQKKD